jgi:hypothetical protein
MDSRLNRRSRASAVSILFTTAKPSRCARLCERWEPDPFDSHFQTCFCRFTSPLGLNGLARATDDALDILAVFADRPGQGAFTKFLKRAQGRFSTIRVLSIWNPILQGFLESRGFVRFMDFDENSHDMIHGHKWTRPRLLASLQNRHGVLEVLTLPARGVGR